MTALAVTDAAALAFADEVGSEDPVAVEGGRTRWTAGGRLHPDVRVVRAPVGIVDYRPEEMTITVRAGTTVAELDTVLAEHGQRSAIPDRGGTVGGAVCVGENHLCVLGRGSVRNAVLQVRYVSAEGELVTAGGPVVKNVSGFNLQRLLVGSLGTLGLVAEVVVRTNPTPPAGVWVRGDIDPQRALDAVLRPGAILWDGSTTWVNLEGHPADVAAELASMRELGTVVEVDGPPALPPNRAGMPPAALFDLPHAGCGDFVAAIGVGTVWSASMVPPRPRDPVSARIAARMKSVFDPTGRLNPGRTPGD